MKTIKIIRGSYGYRADKSPQVKLIDKNSEPIVVSDEEAARLIKLKVAEEVAAEEKPATGHLDAGQFADYSYNELKKLAKDMGLSASGTKEELIERISATEVEIPEEDSEEDSEGEDANEEPPVLAPADPE